MSTPLPPVESVIPHRPPFLMVDEMVSLEATRAVGKRTFRPDEDFFKGHFPGQPIVPGVLLVEGLAQTLAYFALTHAPGQKVLLVGIDRARFRGVVFPGQTVTYQVEIGESRLGVLTGRGKVLYEGKRIAEADLMGYAADEGTKLTP